MTASLFFSFPCNFNTKKQIQHVRKTKRHYIFVNFWFIFTVGSPLIAKMLIRKYMYMYIQHITLNVWFSNYSLDKKKNELASQSNIQLGYQTKWNSHKKFVNGTKSNVSIPNNNCWLASVLIIDLESKQSRWCTCKVLPLFSVKMSIHLLILFTKEKVLKSPSWNHIGNHLNYCSSLLIWPQL